MQDVKNESECSVVRKIQGYASEEYEPIIRYIARFKSIYFEPLGGNHGDELIRLGALKLLKNNRCTICAEPAHAECVIINGGGGMMPLWKSFQTVVNYVSSGVKNIVILPSTFQLTEDDVNELYKKLEINKVKLKIYCRENESLYRMSHNFPDVEIAPDLAFYLSPSDVGIPHARPVDSRYSLVVERRDTEGRTGIAKAKNYRMPLKRFIPDSLIRRGKRQILRKDFAEGPLYKKVKERLPGDSEWVSMDVSDKSLCSFEDFVSYTYFADQVVTTRLHVAILRSIYGKSAMLVPTGGDYRKNEAVFEHSLATKCGFTMYDFN